MSYSESEWVYIMNLLHKYIVREILKKFLQSGLYGIIIDREEMIKIFNVVLQKSFIESLLDFIKYFSLHVHYYQTAGHKKFHFHSLFICKHEMPSTIGMTSKQVIFLLNTYDDIVEKNKYALLEIKMKNFNCNRHKYYYNKQTIDIKFQDAYYSFWKFSDKQNSSEELYQYTDLTSTKSSLSKAAYKQLFSDWSYSFAYFLPLLVHDDYNPVDLDDANIFKFNLVSDGDFKEFPMEWKHYVWVVTAIEYCKEWLNPDQESANLNENIQSDESKDDFISSDSNSLDVLPGEEKSHDNDLEQVISELNALIGLENVKQQVSRLISFLDVQIQRQKHNLKANHLQRHLILTGNPGTGKTTVARLLAKIFKHLGVVSNGQFIEVDGSDLIAEYVGQTAIKTKEIVESALGGILFIDEAYGITNTGSSEFGKDAVNTLIKMMEDNRSDLVVIVAGYESEMEKFLDSNPGLKSRFSQSVHFSDYSSDELTEIFIKMCEDNDYTIDDDTKFKINLDFEEILREKPENFSNARMVRNLFETSLEAHAFRIQTLGYFGSEALMSLKYEDIKSSF